MARRLSTCLALLIGVACLTMLLATLTLTGSASLQLVSDSPLELHLRIPVNGRNRQSNELDKDDTSSGYHVHQTPKIQNVIDDQRLLIAEEMKGYNYSNGKHNISAKSFQDFAPELGGQPIRILVITTWRSGSTFLGDVLDSHPANFYHYEPLWEYGIIQIREEPVASEAVSKLKALLNCNYTGLDHYLSISRSHKFQFSQNTRLWKQCEQHRDICWTTEFLSPFCRLFPLQSMKIIRLRLKFVEELLKDPSLNVRVLLLVRDPRGTLQSRKHRDWCPRNPDCSEPARLCSDLVADYGAAVDLNVKYPNRFRIVRYEDLSLKPFIIVQDLLNFFGLDFHPNIQKFLDTHTKVKVGGAFSTYRNSKSAPFHWRQDLSHQEVQNIQQVCRPAMERWGYLLADNSTHQQDFNPVGSFSLSAEKK